MDLPSFAIGLVALLHTGFFVMESLLWTKPSIRKVFGVSKEEAETSKTLALNQGFYNLGAAVLLIVFYGTGNTEAVMGVLLFLVAMGVVGAFSANWRILVVQSLPALTAFLLLGFS